jgi:DNA polymerase III epsilon subunit-like protein
MTTHQYPLLLRIAQTKAKALAFLDLETTTFMGQPNFGITEMGWLVIHPDGRLDSGSKLVNPQNNINQEVIRITGITQEMVKNQPNWGDELRDITHRWANEHIVLGYNCISFDFPAIVHQNKRYGVHDTVFRQPRDVRSFWRILSGGAKGKLTDVANHYGLSASGAHRALADVIMSAGVLEAMIRERGLDFFDHPGGQMSAARKVEDVFVTKVETKQENGPGAAGKPSSLSASVLVSRDEMILQHIRENGFTSVDKLAVALSMKPFNMSLYLGDMLSDGKLNADIVSLTAAQNWLSKNVPQIIDTAWSNASDRGKLKPVMQVLQLSGQIPAAVDYFQLRVFLNKGGYFAAIEKTENDTGATHPAPVDTVSGMR